jgi:hypothetical protein
MKDSETNSALGRNVNVVMPGGSDGTDPGTVPCDYLTVSGRAQHVRNTTIFVVVMFTLGVVSLGMMVKKSRPEAALAAGVETEEAKIEAAIGRLTGVRSEMMDRMDEILDKFSQFSSVQQVSVSDLSKNPFQLQMLAQEAEPIAVADTKADIIVLLKQQMLKEAATLKLLSIMNSDQGVRCVIGDLIVSKGDTVKNFKVIRVVERQVELEWQPLGVDLRDVDRSALHTVLKLSQ